MSRAGKRLISAGQAREFDRRARFEHGLSTLVLMENAGAASAREALPLYAGGKIVIACGKGNNGGDGFVCARHLMARRIKPHVFVLAARSRVKGEAGVNLRILLSLGCTVAFMPRDISALRKALKNAGVVIDALLGTGIRGDVTGGFRDAIEAINDSGKPVLSLDIPSGLDADTGRIHGCCVKASVTATFVAPKRGMVKNAGPAMCGAVHTIDLGFPLTLSRQQSA